MPSTSPSPAAAVPRARCRIPASTILSSREVKRYKQWQRQTTMLATSEQGYLPTATEYDDFQRWLQKHDSGYFSDVFEDIAAHIKTTNVDPVSESPSAALPAKGTICQHLLHPGEAIQNMPRCPVCTITAHIDYMKIVMQALEKSGGHPPRSRRSSSPSQQETLYQAWCRCKLDSLQELSRLEESAEKADRWAVTHASQDIGDVKTSQEALKVYWAEIAQPLDISPTDLTKGTRQQSESKKNKLVGFMEDTDFEPGRPQLYYWRRSPRYEPGKYACAEESEATEEDSDLEDPPHAKKAKITNEKQPGLLVDDTEDRNNDDDDGHEWQDVDLIEEESDSDDEGDDGEFVVFEDDDEEDDEGSYIVFDN